MPTINDTAKPVALDRNARQLVTAQNVEELGITAEILNDPQFARRDAQGNTHQPVGISINETTFGESEPPTAAERGWRAYMNIGAPLIQERSDIVQPPPETIAYNEYVNYDSAPSTYYALSNFQLENATRWSLSTKGRLTFQVRGMAFSERTATQVAESATKVRASYRESSVDETFTVRGTETDRVHAVPRQVVGRVSSISKLGMVGLAVAV